MSLVENSSFVKCLKRIKFLELARSFDQWFDNSTTLKRIYKATEEDLQHEAKVRQQSH